MKTILAWLLTVIMVATLLSACAPAQPVDPADDPAIPTEDPAEPTEDPAELTDDPAEPTDDPAIPTDDPTIPTDDPTEPSVPVEVKPFPGFDPIDDPDYDYLVGIEGGVASYLRHIPTNDAGEDAEFLLESTAQVNAKFRFADNKSYMIYKFDLSQYPGAVVTFHIVQNYLAEISPDGQNWQTVADYSEGGTVAEHTAGKNDLALVIDTAAYGYTEYLYFRLGDCYPKTGWGGTLRSFDLCYSKPSAISIWQLEAPYYSETRDGQYLFSRTMATTSKGEDAAFIVENTAQSSEKLRYCDGSGYVTYAFSTEGMTACSVTLNIMQNYFVEISTDAKSWTVVEDASDGGRLPHRTDSANRKELPIDLLAFGGADATVYVRISHCYPGTGHGGAITAMTLNYARQGEAIG